MWRPNSEGSMRCGWAEKNRKRMGGGKSVKERERGGTDELQVAIDKFEDLKKKDTAASAATNSSTPGSS